MYAVLASAPQATMLSTRLRACSSSRRHGALFRTSATSSPVCSSAKRPCRRRDSIVGVPDPRDEA